MPVKSTKQASADLWGQPRPTPDAWEPDVTARDWESSQPLSLKSQPCDPFKRRKHARGSARRPLSCVGAETTTTLDLEAVRGREQRWTVLLHAAALAPRTDSAPHGPLLDVLRQNERRPRDEFSEGRRRGARRRRREGPETIGQKELRFSSSDGRSAETFFAEQVQKKCLN